MRRKVAFMLLFFSGGISFQHLVTIPLFYWLTGLFTCLCMSLFVCREFTKQDQLRNKGMADDILIRKKLVSLFVFCFCFFLAGGLRYGYVIEQKHVLWPHEGDDITILGIVDSVQKKEEDYYQITMKSASFNLNGVQQRFKEKVLLTVSGQLPQLQTQGKTTSYEDNEGDSGAWLTGRMIQFTGGVKIPSKAKNPKAFDYRLYLSAKKIYTIVSGRAGALKVLEQTYWPTNSIKRALAVKKASFLENLEAVMDPEAFGLLAGMLFGDREFMDEEVYKSFQKNGIAHILAVSGLHVGILYGCLEVLMRKPKKLLPNLVILLSLIIYAALSGFSPSVVRAVFMIAIYIGSKLWYRRYDFLCCTSFCALVLLFLNPAYLFSTGFQLSFLAVINLSIVMPRAMQFGNWLSERPFQKDKIQTYNKASEKQEDFNDERKKMITKCRNGIFSILAIQIGMAPATAYLFCYFSFGAFLLNTPAILLAGWIIPIGMALLPLSLILSPQRILFQLGTSTAELFIRVLIFLNSFVAERKIGHVWVTPPKVGTLCFYYAALFFVCCENFPHLCKQYGTRRILAAVLGILFFCSSISFYDEYIFTHSDLVFLDVGQGDSVHLKTPEGHHVLVDSGGQSDYDVGTEMLLPYLLRSGAKTVDLAILTHLHQDHYGGIAAINKIIDFPKVALYDGYKIREAEVLSLTGLSKQSLLYVAAGDVIKVDENVYFEVLYPKRQETARYEAEYSGSFDENKWSLVLKLYYGKHTVMLTGDLGEEEESIILKMIETGTINNSLESDVLKVGHHGSKSSSSQDFLEAVSPKASVISVGQNFYGHPSEEALERLAAATSGVTVADGIYRTDLYGAIMMDLDQSSIKVWTMCG